jgi:uncharacterized protein YcbK (DUF882 family)
MSLPVTQHFSVSEFDCHDGTLYPAGQVDDEDPDRRTWLETRLKPLCDLLEAIREAAGNEPLHVNSGYRSLAYDEKLYEASVKDGDVAPASRSQHPKGRAADITHATMRPVALFSLVLKMYEDGKIPQLGGVGLYPGFIHVDVRPKANGHLAVWGGHRPSNIA